RDTRVLDRLQVDAVDARVPLDVGEGEAGEDAGIAEATTEVRRLLQALRFSLEGGGVRDCFALEGWAPVHEAAPGPHSRRQDASREIRCDAAGSVTRTRSPLPLVHVRELDEGLEAGEGEPGLVGLGA